MRSHFTLLQPVRSSLFRMAAAPPSETETVVLPREEVDESLDVPWSVIVQTDPVNLMGYVTMIIKRVFGYPEETARRMMLDVHHKGKCVVWTGARERAEYYVQQLQSAQLLATLKKAS